jgi:predicted XRE-type DNA-binding protein
MPRSARSTAKSNVKGKKGNIRKRVVAKPEVLARFTDEQLEAMEARVSRDIPARELAAMSAAAGAAFRRVESARQLLTELKALRERSGISQAEVDQRSGIGRANISRLENLHLENPTLDTVLRYAHAVGAELHVVSRPGRGRKPAA